jgi:hypothetical protein
LEVLTLLQTGKRDMVPVVFLDEPGGTFWNEWHDYVVRRLLGSALISPEDLALYKLTDKIEDAVAEILGFFEVYHSMRYVRNKLVLRLQKRPGDELMATIHERFGDISSDGQFEVGGPLAEEQDEPKLAHLPRLVFRFNRRSLGKLRQLIDCLNREGVD